MRKVIFGVIISATMLMAFGINFNAGRVEAEVKMSKPTIEAISFNSSSRAHRRNSNDLNVKSNLPNTPIKIINDFTFYDISPDAKLLANAHNIINLKSGTKICNLQNYKKNEIAIFDPNNSNICVTAGYWGGQIKIWNTKTCKLLNTFQDRGKIIFHPSGNFLALETEKYVIIYDISKKHILKKIKKEQYANGNYTSLKVMIFSPKGNFFAIATYGDKIKFWDTRTWRLVKEYHYNLHNDVSMAFSPNEKYFAFAFSAEIILANAKTGDILHNLKGHKYASVSSLSFNFQSNFLISEAFGNDTFIWDVRNGKLLKTVKGYGTVLIPNTNILATSSFERIYLWNIETGEFIKGFQNSNNVKRFKFSKKGDMLVCGMYRQTEIWNVIPYNINIAKKVYEKIDKKDYVALYEFTKRFYYKFNIVQQAYREIYKAIKDTNSIEAYDWYIKKLQYDKGYNWYQKNFGGFASSEMQDVKDKLYKLRQEKFTKEYEKVKKENNLVVYDLYALGHTSPKADNLADAVAQIHKIAFEKAKEIDTISAYNTFIKAFPLAKEVEEANKRAYELEKGKYDIGFFGFIGKDEKLNKQARKIFIKIKDLYDEMPKGNGLGEIDNGYYLVIDRMYRLLKNKFTDTSAYLTFLESDKLKEFKRTLKMKKEELESAWKDLESKEEKEVYPHLHLLMTTVLTNQNSDKSMREFYKQEKLKAKEWIEKNKNAHDKEDFEKLVGKKVENFNTLYKEVVDNYMPSIPKIENMQINGDYDSSSSGIKNNTDNNQKSSNEISNTTTNNESANFNKETKEHLSSDKMKMDIKYEVRGSKVHFKITAQNLYDNAAGGISVSIPSLRYDKDIYSLNQSGFDNAKIYPSGSSLWSGSLKRKITSSYVLIEGWSNKWYSNTQKSLEFSIDKDLIANKSVNIRAVLVKNRQEYLLPTSGATDQQGYPVKQITVNVAGSSNIISSENNQNYKSTQNSGDKAALEQVLNSWNKVMNNKDTSRLEYLYASEIKYYGKHYARSNAIKDKQRALSKYPEFSQQIKNTTYEEITQNLYKVSFDKYVKASPTSQEKLYPSYLYIKKINGEWKIVEESDKVTDIILQEKRSNNANKGLFVCYDKKEIDARGVHYIGCQRFITPCNSNGKLHFGKYRSSSQAQSALIRCKSSQPKFIDSGKRASSNNSYHNTRKLIYSNKNIYHLGDENIHGRKWEKLYGKCFGFNFNAQENKSYVLMIQRFGVENADISINNRYFSNLKPQYSYKRKRPNFWSKNTVIKLPKSLIYKNTINTIHICSKAVKNPEHIGDLDDLQIRNIKLYEK